MADPADDNLDVKRQAGSDYSLAGIGRCADYLEEASAGGEYGLVEGSRQANQSAGGFSERG